MNNSEILEFLKKKSEEKSHSFFRIGVNPYEKAYDYIEELFITRAVISANSFEDLYRLLEGINYLRINNQLESTKNIITTIKYANVYPWSINYIPKEYGLRTKVKEILYGKLHKMQ